MTVFNVIRVDRPGIRCAGLKIRTNMADASRDCTKLWSEEFGPRMADFPADPAIPDESYGVSIMLDSDNFDYWAVMPLAPTAAIPDGMDVLEIPGGLYAECPVKSLKDLGDVYNYLYQTWIPSQEGYTTNMQGAALERYTSEFLKSGSFTVYCPLLEK